MATKRLGLWEKSSIKGAIDAQLSVLRYAAVYPFDVSGASVADTVSYAADPGLVSLVAKIAQHPEGNGLIDIGWQARAEITYEGHNYEIEFNQRLPAFNNLSFNRTTTPHDVYDALGQFARDQWDFTERASTAKEFLMDIVDYSNSAGQIKRLVPWLDQYLGYEAAQSLGDAERKSRIPRALKERIDEDPRMWRASVEGASNTMALAQIANSEVDADRRKISVRKRFA